jgi:transcriptional regulator with XRE-family HTH domain
MSDGDIGGFLRTRREAVKPADVGLPTGPRRRTPGLRRSELATLAGISVEYLTRIEQGRDLHPSSQVLGALADALRLSADDRALLMRLVKVTGGMGPCPRPVPPGQDVRATVRALLRRLEPSPAYVRNRVGDMLAVTSGFEALAGPLGLLDGERPNLAMYVFLDPRARTAFPDWDLVADDIAAGLRLQIRSSDEHLTMLVDELTITAGSSFTSRLSGPLTMPRRNGVLRLVHPDAGALRLSFEELGLPDDQSLVAYLPADAAAEAALDRLAGRRPRTLRAVTG